MKNASLIRWFSLTVIAMLLMGCSMGVAAPTATPVPPTGTPIPPTATPVPPTDTPVPTDTPLPTATPGPIVIDDDFSADNGRFKCESCLVEGGVLTIGTFPMVDSRKPFTVVCEDCGSFANYKMSVDTWYADGNSNRGFGLVVRQGEKYIYLVAVSSWLKYNVFEFDTTVNGGVGYTSLLGGWGKGGLGAGRAVHHIDIVMQGNSMTMILNSDFTRIYELPNGSGQVGLWVGNWETSAAFDNFHFEEIR
jgi:hypothetical protein